MDFRLAKTAVTVIGGVAALCIGSAPVALAAQAAPAKGGTDFVPCSGYALYDAVKNADYAETMTTITIVGHNSTITQARDAGGITLLEVGDCDSADVTVINVNFTNGGGDTDYGGAIRNYNYLTVRGGTFSGNQSSDGGGAIENDDYGHLTVIGATFTHNGSYDGGAIANYHDATIENSAFDWNSASYEGGAIEEDGNYINISGGGFLANTAKWGGAIYTEDDLHAQHITVTANAVNDPSGDAGGIYNYEGTAVVTGSAVFGNQPDNCFDVPGCLL
jgi:hypothetical protein